MDNLAKRKAMLMARMEELTTRIEQIEAELDTPPAQDWEDLAIEREDDEALEGIGNISQTDIRKVNAALERIPAGTYGYCVRCGEKIEPERLDAVPETPFCQSCATQAGGLARQKGG